MQSIKNTKYFEIYLIGSAKHCLF